MASAMKMIIQPQMGTKRRKKKKEKERRKSFFSVGISPTSLWSWHKLLKLCDKARHYIKFEVGNGKDIFLRLDWWHPSGRCRH
jgi:hypothetical protein